MQIKFNQSTKGMNSLISPPSHNLDLVYKALLSQNRSFISNEDLNFDPISHDANYAFVVIDFNMIYALGRLDHDQFANYFSEKIRQQISRINTDPLNVKSNKYALHYLSKWMDNFFDLISSETKVVLSISGYDLLCDLVDNDVLSWIRGTFQSRFNLIVFYQIKDLSDEYAEFVKDAQLISDSKIDQTY